jgi:hypothetical protein
MFFLSFSWTFMRLSSINVRSRTSLATMRSLSTASLAMNSTSVVQCVPLLDDASDHICDRIRLVFSIAELQSSEENFEDQEGEGASEGAEASYPIRCSFTITKVCASTHSPLISVPGLTCHVVVCSWCTEHRRRVPGRRVCCRERLVLQRC